MAVEPIVSEEVWDQVNAILDEQQATHKRPARRPVQLFAGVTRCHCGTKMYVPSNTPKYVCHKCRNKIPKTDLEGIFRDELQGFFFSPDMVAEYLGQADEEIRHRAELVEALLEERKRIEREMDLVYRLYVDEEINPQGFGARNRPLNERRDTLDVEIPRLRGELDVLRVEYAARHETLQRAQDLYADWDRLTSEEKRLVVENFVEEIRIGESSVEIHLWYSPSLSSLNSGDMATIPNAFVATTIRQSFARNP